MPSFRRAQLRGSEELFTPTRTENGEPPPRREEPAGPPEAITRPTVSSAPEGRLVRLTDEEVQTLADAVQRLKFPGHAPTGKPPVEEFERLEELRQKLLSVL